MSAYFRKFHRQQSGTEYRTFLQILHLDLPLLLALLPLIVFGFLVLYSASNQSSIVVWQRMLHMGLAALLMFLLAQIPPYVYQRWAVILFSVGTFLLMVVLIVGHITKGAQRWLNFGLFHIQPSDLMRVAIPMMLAWYFSHRELPPRNKDLLLAALILIVPVLLTVKEPDLGTAIMLMMGGIGILLLAGIRWQVVCLLILAMIIAGPVLWHFLHSYQQQRILTFLNPERDPLGTGYHIIQSKIAIGSGGVFGKGWLHGTQSHLNFLPEHSTDFIFAVCGEEFGLIGGVVLLLMYVCVIARCGWIASQAQDTFSRLLAGSLTIMLFTSVFVNIGMVTGILPVVGLPLPLISYGGSSMVTLMASLGILMSVHGHRTLWTK